MAVTPMDAENFNDGSADAVPTEVFQQFLVSEMQTGLLDYFSTEAIDKTDDLAMGQDAKDLSDKTQMCAEKEAEVVKSMDELARILRVTEADVDERKVEEAELFFQMQNQVEQLETALKEFIAKHGMDLDSSVVMRNDQAEELLKSKHELERLGSINVELKQQISDLTTKFSEIV